MSPTNPTHRDEPAVEALCALAEHCEQADGADREIDCLVWAETLFGGYEWIDNILRVTRTGMRIGAIDPGQHSRNFSCWHCEVPAYTSSLDAASALIPEGMQFGVGRDNVIPGPEGWAWISDDEDYAIVKAATTALALTAAALRARARLERALAEQVRS